MAFDPLLHETQAFHRRVLNQLRGFASSSAKAHGSWEERGSWEKALCNRFQLGLTAPRRAAVSL
jgi:hypothetical protein